MADDTELVAGSFRGMGVSALGVAMCVGGCSMTPKGSH